MNNFDFGFRGDLNPHRHTSKQINRIYVKGIDVSRLNDDQLKEAVKRGYLKDKMLSKQEINHLRNILNERQNEVVTKMTSSSAYYESIRETEVSRESSLAAQNAQRWFSRHHRTENTYASGNESSYSSSSESTYASGSESSVYDRYSGLYHREESVPYESPASETHTSNLSEQQIRYFNNHKEISEAKEVITDKPVPGRISEKAAVITKDNILSDKVKVVSVAGSVSSKEKGTQFIKGKNIDKKAVCAINNQLQYATYDITVNPRCTTMLIGNDYDPKTNKMTAEYSVSLGDSPSSRLQFYNGSTSISLKPVDMSKSVIIKNSKAAIAEAVITSKKDGYYLTLKGKAKGSTQITLMANDGSKTSRKFKVNVR